MPLPTAESVRTFQHLGCWPHVYDRDSETGRERMYCRWATCARGERSRYAWRYPAPAKFPGVDRCVPLAPPRKRPRSAPTMSALQLATLISDYHHAELDSAEIRRMRYSYGPEHDAAYAAERERRRPYREAALDVRMACKLPTPAYGARATSGGPTVRRALRARGLMDRTRMTQAGVELVERALPVLAICGFLGQCGESWTRVRRPAQA